MNMRSSRRNAGGRQVTLHIAGRQINRKSRLGRAQRAPRERVF
jgi:hypothetical protein